MKKIEAIIRTFKLEDVVTRLRLVGVTGMTVSEVHGVSSSTATEGIFHGKRYTMVSEPRYHLMIVVPDDAVAAIVTAIKIAGTTESHGDGIIAIGDVSAVVRVRTGETGPAGL